MSQAPAVGFSFLYLIITLFFNRVAWKEREDQSTWVGIHAIAAPLALYCVIYGIFLAQSWDINSSSNNEIRGLVHILTPQGKSATPSASVLSLFIIYWPYFLILQSALCLINSLKYLRKYLFTKPAKGQAKEPETTQRVATTKDPWFHPWE